MQLKTENGKLREALAKAEQRASTAEANVVPVTNELQRAKDELDALARRLAKAESEAEAYRKEAQSASEKVRELQAEIVGYQRDRKELEAAQKDLKEAQAQAQSAIDKVRDLQAEIVGYQRDRKELEAAQKAAKEAQAQAQSAIDKVRDLQTEIVGYQRDRKELEAAQKAAKEAQADAESTREKLGALEQKNKQWERERKELEGQVQAAQDAAIKTAALNESLKFECLELQELKSKLQMMLELEKGILASRRTIKDLEDLVAILKSENESLNAAVESSTADIRKLRASKTEILSKYAATERNLQDQIFDLIDERNAYKSELDHFYSLPNPCGVGLGLKCTEMPDSKASSSVEVIDVQPV
jgi:chromosome segregation ATPase